MKCFRNLEVWNIILILILDLLWYLVINHKISNQRASLHSSFLFTVPTPQTGYFCSPQWFLDFFFETIRVHEFGFWWLETNHLANKSDSQGETLVWETMQQVIQATLQLWIRNTAKFSSPISATFLEKPAPSQYRRWYFHMFSVCWLQTI